MTRVARATFGRIRELALPLARAGSVLLVGLLVAVFVSPSSFFAEHAAAPPERRAWGEQNAPPEAPPPLAREGSQAPSEAPAAVEERAVASVTAALMAQGEAPGQDSAFVPRPESATRLYQTKLDAKSTITVFAVPGEPRQAIARYGQALVGRGFTADEKATSPREEGEKKVLGGGAQREARLFRRDQSEALVTASPGQAGTVLTVVESERGATR